MKKIDILKPISVRVETETGWLEAKLSGDQWSADGIEIKLSPAPKGVNLTAKADSTGILAIAVRWPTSFEPRALILGDAWERGYGDLTWEPLRWERNNHWYALIDEGETHSALGVRTLAGAMVSWRLDACGATDRKSVV